MTNGHLVRIPHRVWKRRHREDAPHFISTIIYGKPFLRTGLGGWVRCNPFCSFDSISFEGSGVFGLSSISDGIVSTLGGFRSTLSSWDWFDFFELKRIFSAPLISHRQKGHVGATLASLLCHWLKQSEHIRWLHGSIRVSFSFSIQIWNEACFRPRYKYTGTYFT